MDDTEEGNANKFVSLHRHDGYRTDMYVVNPLNQEMPLAGQKVKPEKRYERGMTLYEHYNFLYMFYHCLLLGGWITIGIGWIIASDAQMSLFTLLAFQWVFWMYFVLVAVIVVPLLARWSILHGVWEKEEDHKDDVKVF